MGDESGVISSAEMNGFEASKAYRDRVEAIALDKIGKAKYVSSMQLEETTTALARSQASLDSIKDTVNDKLQDTIYALDDPATSGADEGSPLPTARHILTTSVPCTLTRQHCRTSMPRA